MSESVSTSEGGATTSEGINEGAAVEVASADDRAEGAESIFDRLNPKKDGWEAMKKEQKSEDKNLSSAATSNSKTAATQAQGEQKAKAARQLSEEFDDYVVKVKVNGEDKEIPLSEARKALRLGMATEQELERAKNMQRQLMGLFDQAGRDPAVKAAILEKIGMADLAKYKDLDEFAEKHIERRLAELEETEEQRELRELREEKQARQIEYERLQKQYEQQQLSQKELQAQAEIDAGFVEAVQQVGLPKSPYLFKRMASAILAAELRGEKLSYQQAAAKIRNETLGETRAFLESLQETQLVEFLGETLRDRLRGFELSKLNKPGGNPAPKISGNPALKSDKKKTRAPLTETEWRKAMGMS